MKIFFPVSGVETYWFLPSIITLFISSVVSPAGVSGAFVLLPFQISVLGYTAPGVSATNFIYNIVSIPLGVVRHIRSKNISKNLFYLLLGGTLPGIFLGYYIRLVYLPNPKRFKIFVGCVLLYLAFRTITSAIKSKRVKKNKSLTIEEESLSFLYGTIRLTDSTQYSYPTLIVILTSCVVGVIGGAYGIGGGALMAPFLISVLDLPPYVTSGATLFSTWCTSVVAAFFYAFGPRFGTTASASPDLMLGFLFGLGGMVGIFLGTKLQPYIPEKWIKLLLSFALFFIAFNYLAPVFKALLR